MGHEGETVSHRSGDQDVGHRLLRHTEAVQGRDPEVSLHQMISDVFFACDIVLDIYGSSVRWSPHILGSLLYNNNYF